MSRVFVVRYRYDAEEPTLAGLRPARMQFFQRLAASGELLASGQLLSDEVHGMLLLEASSEDAAARLLDDDPYVTAGVVSSRTFEEWIPTVGTLSSHLK